MKIFFLFLFLALNVVVENVSAQFTYSNAFPIGLNINDQGYSIAADNSGSYYCVGFHGYFTNANPNGTPYYIYNNGGEDGYLAKYSPQNVMDWAFTIGGKGDDRAYRVKVDASDNVYVLGWFTDSVDFDPGAGTALRVSNGGADVFLAKYDNNGNFLWVNTFGGTSDDYGYGLAIDPVTGNVDITGNYISDSMDMDPGNGKHFVVNKGNRSFDVGNVFMASYSSSTGAYIWANNLGGNGGVACTNLATDKEGNIFLTGNTSDDSTDFDPGPAKHFFKSISPPDIFIAKYGPAGNYKWAQVMGGLFGDIGFSVACDGSDNVYVGGYFNSDSVDFDPGPGTRFLKTNGVQDLFIEKFDSSGKYKWAFSAGGYGSEVAQDLTLDNEGHIFVTGSYADSVDFDPGPAKHILHGYSPTNGDGYLAEYDTTGNYMDVIPFKGDGAEFGIGVCIIPPNKVGVTGFFSSDSVDFDPGPAVHNLYVTGGSTTWTDAFVATYYTDGSNGLHSVSAQHEFNVYPNPSDGIIHFLFNSETATPVKLELYNIAGDKIFEKMINPYVGINRFQFNAGDVSKGTYIMRMVSENGVSIQKVEIDR